MKIISFTILVALYITACSHSHETPTSQRHSFILHLQTGTSYYRETSVNLRSGTTSPASAVLDELHYYIFNEDGQAIPDKNGKICRSYTAAQLAVINNEIEEELPEGRYTISLLGIGDKNSNGSNDLQTITEYSRPWIITETTKQLPVKGEYYFATDNIIIPGSKPTLIELKRKVGRVEIDLKVEDQNLKNRIKKIGIQYETGYLYTQMSALGFFSGNTTQVIGYVNEDLTQNLYFYSFPAYKNDGIPGKVLVTVLMNDNTLKTKEFPFSNAPVIENGKTIIHLTLRPGSNESKLNFTGSIKIESIWKEDINLDIRE